MRGVVVTTLLMGLKVVTRVLYSYDVRWIDGTRSIPWREVRLVALLNHTSLYEPVLAGGVPSAFLRRLAAHGVLPIADKTIRRPIIGALFRSLARHVIVITRRRDTTWSSVLSTIEDPDAMVLILPEGRMMRRNGLDSRGQPLSIRAGVADLIAAIPAGRMILAVSGGLHHVQAPGELLPRLFRRIKLNLELIDIESYRQQLGIDDGWRAFRERVTADLERRRNLNWPATRGNTPPGARPADGSTHSARPETGGAPEATRSAT
jgi:hypothetical protein